MPSDGPQAPPPEAPLPEVRFLKILVTTLTATMIAGLVAIIALLVIRLPGAAPLPELPAAITLPDGAQPQSVTFARDHLIVLTDQGMVLIYTPKGELRQSLTLN